MSTGVDPNERKFTQPRSWAAKWCGYGLSDEKRTSAARRGHRVAFAEPRGWSLKWCSEGLESHPRARQ